MSLEKALRSDFDRLGPGDIKVTSDKTDEYNCIAWAAGDHKNWWWPASGYFWPENVERVVTLEAFAAAFSTVGFQPCKNSAHEEGVEKIALFTRNGKPTHASFSLPHGRWASKLGKDHDVEHVSPEALGGGAYGEPTHYFQRKLPADSRPAMPNVMAEFAAKYGVTNNAPRKKTAVRSRSKRKLKV